MKASAFSQSSILGRLHLIKTPVRAAPVTRIKMCLSSDRHMKKNHSPCLWRLQVKQVKSTTPKTMVKSLLISKESPGGEAAALTAARENRPELIQIPCRQGDLALAELKLDLLILEALSLNLWSSQSE